MNYHKIYDLLMKRAESRTLEGYQEKHHKVPRCMGGSEAKENLVCLTPEEHYVAHQLLVKMHPGNISLLWAASNMTGKTAKMGRKNKLYGWLRRRLSEQLKGRKYTPETLGKMKKAARARDPECYKGKSHTEETKKKMSLAAKGRRKSEAHRKALSLAKLGKKRQPHSEKTKQLQSKNIRLALAKKGRAAYFDDPVYKKKQAQKTHEVWAKRRAGLLPPRKTDKKTSQEANA